MSFPVRIHLLDMESSEAIEARILERAERLRKFSRIERCEVWLSSARRHHRHGPVFGLRVYVALPGEDLVVDLQPEEEDVYVAIRQAFDAVRRRLQDATAQRRGHVKTHPRARGRAKPRGASKKAPRIPIARGGVSLEER